MTNTTQLVFTLTAAQLETLKGFNSPHIDMSQALEGVHVQDINVLETIDDTDVNSYVVKPDGTYTRETLTDFGQGWEQEEDN